MSRNETNVVKQPYKKDSYTDVKIAELMMCLDDPLYFMRTFMKVQHPIRGALPFHPYPFQERMIKAFHENRFAVALTARQMGKSLDLTIPILTPTGFTTVGELKVGDIIYGADGKPTKVTYITEVMHNRPCYEIEFIHGEKIVADAEHLWTINLPRLRRGNPRTVTTVEMRDLHNKYKESTQSIFIQHTNAIEFEDKDCPVDPYLLGVYLGDGSRSDARISCHIDDYPHYVQMAAQIGVQTGNFKPDKRRPTTGTFKLPNEFRLKLKELGLLSCGVSGHRKFIPDVFLFTSKEKRLRLLQGLMDTDGSVERGGCRFYQSDKEFAEQVRFLVSSLGIKSTLRSKKTTHKDCYTVSFATNMPVVTLPRKFAKLSLLKGHPKINRIYIRSITEVPSVPVRCLQVDNADHLFLCGKTLIPTHNTTVAAGYLLWRAMFTPDTTILIVANGLNQALEIMARVRYAYENLPDHIRAGITEYNKGSITFDNGSRIVSRATSADAARGLSITLLYCDEFAFLRSAQLQQEFWTSVQPTLSTGGSCIVTSTPKNDEDIFAQIWKGAIANEDEFGNPLPGGVGKNGWFPIEVKWDEHPERDEKWAETFRHTLGEAKFRQEFCCEFVSDDESLINALTLARMTGRVPEFYTNTVRWYKNPESNKAYVVGLDPSLGTGGDYAAIQVFELPEMTQVAEWRHNKTDTRGQIRVFLQILWFLDSTLRDDPAQYSDPEIYWTVENNTIGEAVLQIIEDTGEDRFPGMFVSERKRKGQSRKFRKGMLTDNKRKLSACARFKSLVESGRMTINSQPLIKELKNFIATEASYKAKPGEHDDLVMAALLCVRMLDVVGTWGADMGELKEHIGDDELFEEAMPVVI